MFRTIASKHAWLDNRRSGWARPNIADGSGYHWDVFLEEPMMKEAVGVDQVNVVEFGAPSSEGRPGHLHHIPSAKAGRVKDEGWTC